MNSYIDLDNTRRNYTEETFGDRAEAAIAGVICAVLSFLDGVIDFFERPLVALAIKSACVIFTLVVILGAVGGIEAGTLTFASAAIRILGSSAITLIVFKGLAD